jgi:hypothetical protein
MTKETDNKIQALKLDLKQVSRGYSILNENQVQKLFNTTPQRWTYRREGKAGQSWRYVKRGYVRRTLDSVFGFNWDFVPETSTTEAFEVAKLTGSVIIKGTLTCRVLDARGQVIATLQKGDYGRADVKFLTETVDVLDEKGIAKRDPKSGYKITAKQKTTTPLDFGNDLKAASTDCFKRCAMWLGVAADVYDPEEFMAIEIVGADGADDKVKNTENLIKKAKASIKVAGKEVNDAKR